MPIRQGNRWFCLVGTQGILCLDSRKLREAWRRRKRSYDHYRSISNPVSGVPQGGSGRKSTGSAAGSGTPAFSAKDISTYSLHEYNQVKQGALDRTGGARKDWHPTVFASDGG